ncbi:hypothetical protein BDN70DRAFT_886563 [Pholiota conissans]|uniref:Uncharacterized protein n=1 Tax=Pholiota conissans TaxID=109636 RepID=A0A9P6CUP5_9AGAR|nr:hypothetical protein BDN70DRAFT_886563 [Pholiota conissans]
MASRASHPTSIGRPSFLAPLLFCSCHRISSYVHTFRIDCRVCQVSRCVTDIHSRDATYVVLFRDAPSWISPKCVPLSYALNGQLVY